MRGSKFFATTPLQGLHTTTCFIRPGKKKQPCSDAICSFSKVIMSFSSDRTAATITSMLISIATAVLRMFSSCIGPLLSFYTMSVQQWLPASTKRQANSLDRKLQGWLSQLYYMHFIMFCVSSFIVKFYLAFL